MRTLIRWAAGLLTVVVAALVPGIVSAQQEPTTPRFFENGLPIPTNPNLSDGIFIGGEFVMFQGTNPLKPQLIAVRGFTVTLPNAVPQQTGNTFFPVGTFVGSRTPALDVQQVTGQQYVPGFKLDIGYKFQDGTALTLDWFYLFHANKSAAATFAAPGLRFREDLADTFLSSATPVSNFPPEFSGPRLKITDAAGVAIPDGAIGIWNGATIMTIEYQQRVQSWDLTYRVPIWETENCRVSGQVGPRFFWIHERFRWWTNDVDVNGNAGGTNAAWYTQVVSNRMYGAFCGSSYEQYLGGGFACQVDLGAAAMLDIVKEKATYKLDQRFIGPESKRARADYTLVPELTASAAIVWYPVSGVQFRAGYNFMGLFNTVGSKNPVSFDASVPDPKYNRIPLRLYDGLDVGLAFIF